jgi:hypothetical protein
VIVGIHNVYNVFVYEGTISAEARYMLNPHRSLYPSSLLATALNYEPRVASRSDYNAHISIILFVLILYASHVSSILHAVITSSCSHSSSSVLRRDTCKTRSFASKNHVESHVQGASCVHFPFESRRIKSSCFSAAMSKSNDLSSVGKTLLSSMRLMFLPMHCLDPPPKVKLFRSSLRRSSSLIFNHRWGLNVLASLPYACSVR